MSHACSLDYTRKVPRNKSKGFLSGSGGFQIEQNEASLIENEDFLLRIQGMLDIVER